MFSTAFYDADSIFLRQSDKFSQKFESKDLNTYTSSKALHEAECT